MPTDKSRSPAIIRTNKNRIKRRKKSYNNITGISDLRQNKEYPGPFALDCEMVGVGKNRLSALARVTIIDKEYRVLYDVHVKPTEPVTDYRTPVSGIREVDLVMALPFEVVQSHVIQLLSNKVVVGHSVFNDFKVLDINHPSELIRDLNKCELLKIKAGYPHKASISLRNMASILLQIDIQSGEHCSLEDARASMALYQLVEEEWESDLRSKCSRKRCVDQHNYNMDELLLNVNNTNSLLEDNPVFTAKRIKLLEEDCTINNSNGVFSFLDDKYWTSITNDFIYA